MTTTLTSGTQQMQLRTTLLAGQGWTTQRFDFWRGEWEAGALSAPSFFDSESECEADLQQRTRDFLSAGWQLTQ